MVRKSRRGETAKRLALGRQREEALFPAPPPRTGVPAGYAEALREIKNRIREERLRVALAANAAMLQLYWHIGRTILTRQAREGWGAKVIDRLSADLRDAFPDMSGLSPRNLRYMRDFASAWPEPEIVQRLLPNLPWGQNVVLLDKLRDPGQPTPQQQMAQELQMRGAVAEVSEKEAGAQLKQAQAVKTAQEAQMASVEPQMRMAEHEHEMQMRGQEMQMDAAEFAQQMAMKREDHAMKMGQQEQQGQLRMIEGAQKVRQQAAQGTLAMQQKQAAFRQSQQQAKMKAASGNRRPGK